MLLWFLAGVFHDGIDNSSDKKVDQRIDGGDGF
jgi:hypothetical protein